MPFNGSGGFNRVRKWVNDATANIKIKADFHDQEDDNLAAGLSAVITKDGQTQPTGNLPLNGKRWVNAGDPVDPQDYATKHWVEVLPGWTTSKSISGADVDGRLNFTSPTGVNGITWATANMGLFGKIAEANKISQRLVVNSAASAGGADLLSVDDAGHVNFYTGVLTWNLSWDGDEYRTVAPGTATKIDLAGGFSVKGLDAATTLDPYKAAPLREYFEALNNTGSPFVNLYKSASAKVAAICGHMGTARRWLMYMGDATAEANPATGSNFALYSYDNDGTTLHPAMLINRSTRAVNFYGNMVVTGSITSGSNFDSTSTICILSATSGGSVRIRPDGPAVATSSTMFNTNGDIAVCESVAACGGGVLAGRGVRSKAGYQGAYDSNWMNLENRAGPVHLWVDGSDKGTITVTCDYRAKTDVQPLPSQWDAVKALRPISFKWQDWTQPGPDGGEPTYLSQASDEPQWGFLAHELQETLLPSAANGKKDEENVVQSPNLLAVVAALTSALQEALARIEALEAAA